MHIFFFLRKPYLYLATSKQINYFAHGRILFVVGEFSRGINEVLNFKVITEEQHYCIDKNHAFSQKYVTHIFFKATLTTY